MSQRIQELELELDLIVSDEELKIRVEINQETVREYYEAMETEEDVKKFPPPTVYFDGCHYWLADGHHRYWAAFRRGYKTMTVKIVHGTHDEAILAAVRLNSKNGLRFKNDDWEKIIVLVASKEQWKDWSNRKLADELKCSYQTIRRYRPDSSVDTGVSTEKRQGKDGKMYKARKARKPQPETNPGTAPQSPPVASETAPAPNASAEFDVATDGNTGDVSKTASVEIRPIRGESARFVEARTEWAAIVADIDAVVNRINKWFDNSPPSLHKEFDDELRKRLGEICD